MKKVIPPMAGLDSELHLMAFAPRWFLVPIVLVNRSRMELVSSENAVVPRKKSE